VLPTALSVWPVAAAAVDASAANTGVDLLHFVFELAAILIAARIGGLVFQRWLRMPSVIGELLAGIAIGPFALGGVDLPHLGALFPRTAGSALPVSAELYALATLASLLLLFMSGLETDLAVFLRYFTVGSAVGIGGVVVSFFAGAGYAVWAGLSPTWFAPPALFLGAVSTATSVGITARILSERRKTDSPEGVTILAAAVFDDVLGIIVLAVVLALVKADETQGAMPWGRIGLIMARTLAIWLVCTAGGILAARRISRGIKWLGSHEAIAALAFGLALLLSGTMESAGLAMIIGAYVMGLSLSRTDLAFVIRQQLHGAASLLVPVFFCVMGMLIDLAALRSVFWSGLVFSALAALAKVLGCGIPALATRFNLRGATRIGIGMMPRGEVALIIAGIGLATRSASPEVFGLAVLMTVVTTVLAPPLLVRSFARGSGVRMEDRALEDLRVLTLDFGNADLAAFLADRIAARFRDEEFYVTAMGEHPPFFQIRKDQMVFTLQQEGPIVHLSAPARYADIGRFVVLEETLTLKDIFESLKNAHTAETLSDTLAGSLFDRP